MRVGDLSKCYVANFHGSEVIEMESTKTQVSIKASTVPTILVTLGGLGYLAGISGAMLLLLAGILVYLIR